MGERCPKCGTAYTEGDEYCTTCGRKRKVVSPPPRKGLRSSTIVLIVLLAAACIVIGVLAGALIAVPQGGDDNPDAGQTVTPTPTPTPTPDSILTPVPEESLAA